MNCFAPVILLASLALTACGDRAASSGKVGPTQVAPAMAPASPAPTSPAAPEVEVVPVEDSGFPIPAARYPALVARAATADGFAPRGWTVEHSVSGDLNGDRRPDLVIVLRQRDPANIIRHGGLGESPLDTNPRILAVALATPGGPLHLLEQNHVLIPRTINPVFQDPLEEAPVIRSGVLTIRLAFFASAGSWTMSNATSKFRLRQGQLELIGHDYNEVRRNTGEMVERSVNFLTRRVSTVNTTIDAEGTVEPVWTTLPAGPLLTLEQIGDGLAFDPVPAD